MKSERVMAALGILMGLTLVLVLVAKRRADEEPDVAEAPSGDASDSDSSEDSDSSDNDVEADPLVDEMGRESFPASDPPATY